LPAIIAGITAALVMGNLKLALTAETKELIEIAAILLLFWPSIAVQVKRWHDLDKSGWWVLANLVPIIGGLIFIGIGFIRGTRGNNRFGSDPAA